MTPHPTSNRTPPREEVPSEPSADRTSWTVGVELPYLLVGSLLWTELPLRRLLDDEHRCANAWIVA